LPLLDRGFLEFGSLNDISKVSDTILHCWGRILAELPSARLRLRRTPEGYGRDRVTSLLGGHGIESGRISFSDWFGQVVPGQQYADIDVALDSFPFNGVTTTCESLWMGLPVVTWMGQHSIARSGSSILKALGLPELIAHDADSYVRAAVALGRNPEHLVALRGSLRERMRQSALMDEDTFVKALEGLYRSTWTERVKEDADRSRLAETR
jgi:predicted O-linked N-acetylglucosamine transferase (SPINDLY family)